MPALIITTLRFLLISIVQTAAFLAASQALERLIDYVHGALTKDGGASDDEADAIVGQEIIDALALIGVTIAALKTRLPIRLADKIGLKIQRAQTQKVSAQATTKIAKAKAKGGLGSAAVKAFVVGLAGSFAAFLVWLPSIIQQFADQATFQPRKANDFYESFFGFRPFPEGGPKKSKVLSDEIFDKIYATYSTAGATSIRNPYKLQSVPYTKDNLIDLTNEVGAKILLEKGKADTKSVLAMLDGLILTSGTAAKPVSSGGTFTPPTGTPEKSAYIKTLPQVQVFTGVLVNGTLGTPGEFVARPDDMIQSIEELKTAANINLASFARALPGNLYYEIAVVPSVKTRGGFTQKGSAIKIVSGYYKDGSPRYKVIYHKFAVLKIGVFDENRRTVRLGTIVLGPVNPVDFQPTTAELATIAGNINAELFTNKIGDVREVITAQELKTSHTSTTPDAPTTGSVPVSPPVGAETGAKPPPEAELASPSIRGEPVVYKIDNSGVPGYNIIVDPWTGEYNYPGKQISYTAGLRLLQSGAEVVRKLYEPAPGFSGRADPAGAVAAWAQMVDDFKNRKGQYSLLAWKPPTFNAIAANAANLYEYFSAFGKVLPEIASRAELYQWFGLGAASTYTGTAEQNNRLLVELKRTTGVL